MLKVIILFAIATGIAGNLYDQHTYRVIYERSVLTYFNPRFFKSYNVYNSKFNRTTKTISVKFHNIIDIPDITSTVQTYVFLSNEYRSFPMRFLVDVCQSMERNFYGFANFMELGNITKCPFKPGIYYLKDYLPDYTKFPPNIPAGNYKIACNITCRSDRLIFVDLYIAIEKIIRMKKIRHSRS